MTPLTLAMRNAFRSKRRTALTVLSIGISVFAIGMLATFLESFDAGLAETEALGRLVVKRRTSLADRLPESYKERIEAIELDGKRAVEYAHGTVWFGGTVDRVDIPPMERFFANFGDETSTFRAYMEPMTESTSPGFYESFADDKTSAVIGEKLARRFGWKIGDRVTLRGTIYPVNPEFVIVGTFHFKPGLDDNMMCFRRDRLEELLAQSDGKVPGKVGVYIVKPAPGRGPAVAKKIDEMFTNSPAETETVTEREFQASFTEMLGNIRQFVAALGTAVALSILLVAGNTMAMSARERSNEAAVMKTLGFEGWHIVALFLFEGVAVTLTGGLVGVGGVWLMTRKLDFHSGFFASFELSRETVVLCLGLALGVGVVAAGIPALITARRPIATALRKVV